MIPKSMPLDLIRGWKPVFGKDHAQMKNLDLDPIQLNWIKVQSIETSALSGSSRANLWLFRECEFPPRGPQFAMTIRRQRPVEPTMDGCVELRPL
jgi:hypothetical protein